MTVAPRWRKVLREVGGRPQRAALAVLAMATGAFALGMVLTSFAVLRRELAATYATTHPASAVLATDAPLTDGQVAAVRRLPGVLDAESRPVWRGRLRVGDHDESAADDADLAAPAGPASADWAPLAVFVVRDFADLRVDRFVHEAGAWPPAPGEILLERSGLPVARAAVGDSVTVRAADGSEHTLRIAGTVHAPGLAPSWMDHVVYGFAAAPPAAGQDPELSVVVAAGSSHDGRAAGAALDERRIRAVAAGAQAWLATQHVGRVRLRVPTPGRHPHADQMEAFLFLLGAFGALTAVLSAILTANMIHALLVEQIRQVGIMKTIGATSGQVAALYLGQVALLAALALGLGMPLGAWAGGGYVRFAATLLNATIADATVPFPALAAQVALGLAIPLAAALGPVRRAARITIQEALRPDAGIQPFGASRLDAWLARRRWLSRPLRLSLRTALHRRGRLLLTVGTLAVGGAVFISALNVSASLGRTLDQDARTRRFDLEIRLAHPQRPADLAAAVAGLRDVAHAEAWAETAATVVAPQTDGTRPPPGVTVLGPERGTRLLSPILLAGRWLRPEDDVAGGAAVVNQALTKRLPALHVGGTLSLRANDRTVTLPIVGIVEELVPALNVYAPPAAVSALLAAPAAGGATAVRSLRIVAASRDAAAQRDAGRAVEQALVGAGIAVTEVRRMDDLRQALKDHFVIVVSALVLAASLVILVGGLGLTSALTLDVLERTREIGILGTLGATPRTIAGQVVVEGVVLGLLSACVAVLAACPVTLLLDVVAGRIFVGAPFLFTFSPRAALLWLAVVVALAAASSFPPAWRAARRTVAEALTYA